jgi:hypothetical protein
MRDRTVQKPSKEAILEGKLSMPAPLSEGNPYSPVAAQGQGLRLLMTGTLLHRYMWLRHLRFSERHTLRMSFIFLVYFEYVLWK